LQYRFLEVFVHELKSKGKYSFTAADLRNGFDLSDEALKKALQRLIAKKEAAEERCMDHICTSCQILTANRRTSAVC
jgi:hypothetical protein